MATNYQGNWEPSEALTLSEGVVLKLGLQITDNLSLPWQDGVSFLKNATTVAAAGQTTQVQISEDLLMAPQGDAAALLFQYQLAIAETITLSDVFFYRFGKNATSGGANKLSHGDNFAINQKDAFNPVLQIQLSFSDNLNYWIDPIFGNLYELDLILGCPELGLNWFDDGSPDFVLAPSQIEISDRNIWSRGATQGNAAPFDPIAFVLGGGSAGELASLIDNGQYNWNDAFAFSTAVSIALQLSDSISLSDSLLIGYGLLLSDDVVLILQDSGSGLWSVSTTNSGLLTTGSIPSGTASNGLINDPTGATSWQVGITTSGLLTTTSVAFNASYPTSFQVGHWLLQVTTGGLLQTTPAVGTLADALSKVLTGGGLSEVLSDNEGANWADALGVGYGQGNVDALTFLDATSVGYGDQIADTLSLSDSEVTVLGLTLLLSDSNAANWSDAIAIGYGNAEVDTLVFADSMSVGYGLQIAEALSMSDSLIVGYGNATVDQLIFIDSSSVGYGDQIADSFTLTDAFAEVLSIAVVLSDSLNNWADALAIGYGNAVADQIVLSDSEIIGYGDATVDTLIFSDATTVGYGLLIADQLSLSDSVTVALGINESFSDQFTLTDSEIIGYGNATVDSLIIQDANSVGYGDLIADQLVMSDSFQFSTGAGQQENLSDTMTMSDALELGYGNATVETLVFVDASAVGYGSLIADAMTLSDAFADALSIAKMFTDTLSFSDSIAIGYGNSIAEQIVLSDGLIVGHGQGMVDALTFIDSSSIGYGDIISDSMNNWLDSFQFSTGQPAITLSLSDSVTFNDTLGAGYGCQINEQVTLQDSSKLIEDLLMMIAEAPSALLDSLQALFTYGLSVNDLVLFQDQLGLLYGLQISETFTFSDRLDISLLNLIALLLSDSEAANWFDDFIAKFVFVPGAMTFDTLELLNQMVMGLQAYPEMDSDGLTIELDDMDFGSIEVTN